MAENISFERGTTMRLFTDVNHEYDLADFIRIKHMPEGKQTYDECWVTGDRQAHYDINEAIVRQLELINNAVHLIYKRKCCD